MDFSSEDLVIGGHSVHLRAESGLARDRRLVTIDMLPDDVLVEIFFHVNMAGEMYNEWHALVHACRRWRYVVFASPRHLNLQLEYRGHRPMSEVLDAWPVLPVSLISIDDQSDQRWENRVAALESEHYNRISKIRILLMANSLWERVTEAMQKPFPELTHLQFSALGEVPVLPDSFLGGSAPRLRMLCLGGIPFPLISKLLLSANGLVTLSLWSIPDSGYFSPDAIATALTVMTRLEILRLRFNSPQFRPYPESRSFPLPTRFILPALTQLEFEGAYEYLEHLLARIDAPLLYHLKIVFFIDLDFDVPQLHRLIGHAEEFKTFDRADVSICNYSIELHLYPDAVSVDDGRRLKLQIKCVELNDMLSSLAQVCNSSFPFISALEELQIKDGRYPRLSRSEDDTENGQWLEILDPFTALKNLYLSDGIARRVCGALQELPEERVTEVLPALRNLSVPESSLEPVQEAMKSFATARQLSGHPVVVHHW